MYAPAQGGQCSYYSNADEAFLGINPINVGYGDIRFNAAYTYNHTEITKSNTADDVGTAFNNVPLHSFNASLNFDTHKFGAYIREEIKTGIYRGNPNVVNSAATARGEFYNPYYLTHIGGYYKFKDNLRLNLAVYNLFNFDFIDYMPYTGTGNAVAYANAYNYIREGRRYYISFIMDF